MIIADRITALAEKSEQRYRERSSIRGQRIRAADRGALWQSDDPDRIAQRLGRIPGVQARIDARSPELTELAIAGEPAATSPDVETLVTRIAQERIIGRDDLVTPQFLKLALAASRCVCRITVRNEGGTLLGFGTGVLVGPGVLLTNNHALEKAADARQSEATFGFDLGAVAPSDERLFLLDPARLFITDESLDSVSNRPWQVLEERDYRCRAPVPLADHFACGVLIPMSFSFFLALWLSGAFSIEIW